MSTEDLQLAQAEKKAVREALEAQREFRRTAQNIKWRNPIQDQEALRRLEDSSTGYGTEKDVLNCAFFLKTGSCRYGEACSKFHPYPSVSGTLLFRNMYEGPGMKEANLGEDADLENDEQEVNAAFSQFWYDVVPEFRQFGRLKEVRVCRNHSIHLRGNVYVVYENEESAVKAFNAFSQRYYGGKKLIVEYSPVQSFKTAICGIFTREGCDRGKECNFLHVFRNPDGELEGGFSSEGRRGGRDGGRDGRGGGDRRRGGRYDERDRRRDGRVGGRRENDRERERNRDRHRDRERDRERDRDRGRDRDRDRDRERRRDRRDQDHADHHSREGDVNRRHRDHDKNRDTRDDRKRPREDTTDDVVVHGPAPPPTASPSNSTDTVGSDHEDSRAAKRVKSE